MDKELVPDLKAGLEMVKIVLTKGSIAQIKPA